ncbi:MAG: hypothetical protein JWN67_2299 [Actinomycetia bacterium]|nr:hypothetical protein [Actinomycetes bacterium]
MEFWNAAFVPLKPPESPCEGLDDRWVTGHTSAVAEAAEPESTIDAVARAFHGLINSASVIIGGAETLQASWSRMTDSQRDFVIDMVLEQSRTIQALLRDLSERPPGELHEAIERHTATEANLEAAKRAAAEL